MDTGRTSVNPAGTIKNLVTFDPVVPTEKTMETARPKAIANGASKAVFEPYR